MLLCILPSKQFDDTCENTKGDEFQTIATNVTLRLLRQAIKESFENSTTPHCGKKPFQHMISDNILGEHSDTFQRLTVSTHIDCDWCGNYMIPVSVLREHIE